MRNIAFIVLSVVFTTNVFSQITINHTDLIGVGDIIYIANDTTLPASISIGNSGVNQNWDFSYLEMDTYDTTECLDPLTTPYSAFHPTANMCTKEDDGEYTYWNKSATGLTIVGADNISFTNNQPTILPLPLNYGSVVSIPSITYLDSSFPNPGLIPPTVNGVPTAAVISGNPTAQSVDSLRFVLEQAIDFNVDAWGNVTIPMGSFDALRVKADETATTTYFAYCSLLTGGGGWYPLPASIFPSEIETRTYYTWWTNDVNARFALLRIDVDQVSGDIDAVEFLYEPSIPSWDCDPVSNCSDPGNGQGMYSSLSDCQNACAVSWNCTPDIDPSTWSCDDPGDGSGFYSTKADCDAACSTNIVSNLDERILFYPNPINGYLNIKLESGRKYNVSINNLVGKTVYNGSCSLENTKLDLSYLTKGVYFISLKNIDQELTRKIIIE